MLVVWAPMPSFCLRVLMMKVPFLYSRAGEICYEKVKIGEATCEKVGGDHTLCVTQWGATNAVTYLFNFLVHQGLLIGSSSSDQG